MDVEVYTCVWGTYVCMVTYVYVCVVRVCLCVRCMCVCARVWVRGYAHTCEGLVWGVGVGLGLCVCVYVGTYMCHVCVFMGYTHVGVRVRGSGVRCVKSPRELMTLVGDTDLSQGH